MTEHRLKKSALLAGATGAVGSKLLHELLRSNQYSRIIILSRRKLDITFPLIEVQIVDFENLTLTDVTESVDDVFCCLGTTRKKAGSLEAFKQVDLTYVVSLARLAARQNAKTFSVISSLGANARSSNDYLKTKGEMEEFLTTLQIPALYIYRPSLLHGERSEFRLLENIGYWTLMLFSPLFFGKLAKYRPVETEQLAKMMVQTVASSTVFSDKNTGAEVTVFESDEILAHANNKSNL